MGSNALFWPAGLHAGRKLNDVYIRNIFKKASAITSRPSCFFLLLRICMVSAVPLSTRNGIRGHWSKAKMNTIV